MQELTVLPQDLTAMEIESAEILRKVDARHRVSAANLIHYLGLRRRDVRPLQEKLAAAGLSSVGRAESHVLSNLDAIIMLLRCAMDEQTPQSSPSLADPAATGPELLETNTNNLLGKPPPRRRVRILVTLPGDAADNYALIKEMLLARYGLCPDQLRAR